MSYVSQISKNDIIDSKSSETNWHLSSTIIRQYTLILDRILDELMKIKSCLCILCACVYYFNAPSSKSPETGTDADDKYLRLVMGLFFMLSRHPDFYPFKISGFASLTDLIKDGFDKNISQVKNYLNASHLEAHAFGKTSNDPDLGSKAHKLTEHLFNEALIKKQEHDNSENVSQDISTDSSISKYLNQLKKYKDIKENIF